MQPGEFATLSDTAIEEALEALRRRIADARRHINDLTRTIEVSRAEERLLEQLLALRRGPNSSDRQRVLAQVGALHDGAPTRVRPERSAPSISPPDAEKPLVQAVYAELAAAGRPLHISDLMRVLRDQGIEIPGAGAQANLITYLRRDTRLVRPSRGMYALAGWGLEDMQVVTPRMRKKRMRVTGSKQ